MSATTTMTTRAAAATLALLAAWSAALAENADWQAERARRDKEATVLFATIVKNVVQDVGRPFDTCEIDADWDTFPIDYAIAHKAVGLKVHANLANPFGIPTTSVIFGAAVPKDAICDKAARERYRAGLTAAWETAAKALPSGSKPPPRPFFSDTFFSYPLFDRDFRRAVLIYGRQSRGPHVDDDGKRLIGVIKGFGAALVYARTGKAWHKVTMTYLYGQG